MSEPTGAEWVERLESVLGGRVERGSGGPPIVVVPASSWVQAVRAARDQLGCRFFDFLSAVDRLDAGFDVLAHIADVGARPVRSVLLRANVPREAPAIGCLCTVFAGAGWHEREAHEMFGIEFDGHGPLAPLLLPEEFDGHPLRKDFVLASRVSRPWPGAKEPGESDADQSSSRRRTRPPGVPDPTHWPPPSDS